MKIGLKARPLIDEKDLDVTPEPVETVTSTPLTTAELREASRMVHEALGVEHVEPCAECLRAFAAHAKRDGWALPELDSPAYHSEAADRLKTNGYTRTNRGASR